MGTLSSAERNKMPNSDFAIPSKRAYPIPDIDHARNALARVAENGTPAEQAQVRAAVYAKYPSLKNDTQKVWDGSFSPQVNKTSGGYSVGGVPAGGDDDDDDDREGLSDDDNVDAPFEFTDVSQVKR